VDVSQVEKQREREVFVSRAKLVLIIVCLIAIPVTFYVNHLDVGSIRNKVTASEPPCLKYGSNSRQCHESFQAAIDSITDFQLCTLLSKRPDLTGVNSSDCREIAREAKRAAARAVGAAGGGGAQNSPETGTQQSGPSVGGAGGGTGGAGGGPAKQPPNPPNNPADPGGPAGPANPSPAGPTGDQPVAGAPEGGGQAEQPAGGGGEQPAAAGGPSVDLTVPQLPAGACVDAGPVHVGANCP
jgi:hypothetical protein